MQTAHDAPLAIVGMACRVPGADNLADFWQLLVTGGCAIAQAPASRIDRSLHHDPKTTLPYKTYTNIGGVISYPPFDAGRCPVPTRSLPEAEVGHQTICQVAAEACRHAAMNPFDLPLRNAGVYIGHNLGGPVGGNLIYSTLVESTAQYLLEIDEFLQITGHESRQAVAALVQRIRDRLPRRNHSGSPECSTRLASILVSEALGLSGPSMILDAACSSGLQGLAMAARGLRLGRIDMAIVGGASYYHVDSQIIFSRAQSASRRGISCPFDADADGLVSGEGYVAVVVKTLERALADGDPIQCVVRGIGVSADGRGKSLWAPRKEGQVLAIERAYAGGLDRSRLQYIEAHATSTRIGDITELRALAETLRDMAAAGRKIPLGALKANIGHTLESAGLLGLVKTVLAMQHQTIPGQINVRQLTPEVDWDQAPFYVPTENVAWPAFDDGHPRRAAVNSFGIGGLNVHIVIDEFAEHSAARPASKPSSAPVSAAAADEPVAIIGAGCIFPGARTLEAFWELLDSGRDPKCDAPPDRWNAALVYEAGSRRSGRSASRRGGFITDFKYDWRRHKLPPNQVEKADPLQFMILDATDAALADSGYDKKPYDKTRVGVVAGTVFGSDFCDQLQMGFRLADFRADLSEMLRERGVDEGQIAAIGEAYVQTLLKHCSALLDETGSFTPSTLVSRITKMFDLMGGAMTIDAGQASSLAAIYSGVDMLLDGSCDMVICAAGHRAMGLTTYETMSLRGDLAADEPAAPFDALAHGHLPGEGTGVLVLKRLSDARRDGDRIRGIIRGVGAGFSIDRSQAVAQAIGRASAAAGASAASEVLLETAGYGAADDEAELAGVTQSLAGSSRPTPLVLSSLVAQIGHTQGASGMASLLAAMRSLDKFEVVSRLGMSRPAGFVAAQGSALRLASEKVRLAPEGAGELLAGINSLDSFGAAYHLVLQRGIEVAAESGDSRPKAVPETRAQPAVAARIVRLEAASIEALRELAGQAAGDADRWFAAAESCSFSPEAAVRMAIVAASPADLAEKLKLAGARIGTPQQALLSKKDIFIGQPGEPGDVAFVFSGQGSQYAGMLKPLIEQFPAAAESLERIEQTLARMGMPAFAEFAWQKPEALGKDVWLTQLSLLCADVVLFESLAALGIRPAWVCGHSYGEFPALLAAGVWDFETAVRATRARSDAIVGAANVRGLMMSVAAPGALVEQLCRDVGGEVFAANYNTPAQTVVGGSESAIAELEARLKAQKIACKRLAVPRPFHTPLMQDTQPLLAAGLASLEFNAPQLPTLSSVTNRPVVSGDEARTNLVDQMITPVRWVELIEALFQRGVRVLVEVGPNQILSGLNQQILTGREGLTIASDEKDRGGLSRLLAVRAGLEVRGQFGPAMQQPAVERTIAAGATASASGAVPTAAPPASAVSANGRADSDRIQPSPGSARLMPMPVSESNPLMLAGTPIEIGREYGRQLADDIQGIARRYADIAGMEGEDSAEIEPWLDKALEYLEPAERDELAGIAEGAGVSAAMLAVYNAWADACQTQSASQAVAPSGGTDSSLLHAFGEQPSLRRPWGDLDLSPRLRVDRPAGGLVHAMLAWPGLLGASAGSNERGLAISSTAEQSIPAARATLRRLLVKRVLQRAETVDAAVEMLCREAGKLAADFCITHSALGEVRCVRLTADGRVVVTSSPTVVRFAESPVAETVGARSASGDVIGSLAAENRLHDGWPPELSELAEEFLTIESTDVQRQQHVSRRAAAQLALVMDPAAGEIAFRSTAADGRQIVSRYQFGPASVPASPPKAPEPARQRAKLPADSEISWREYVMRSGSVGGAAPFDEAGRSCHRFALRLLDTLIPEVDPTLASFAGPALIVGRNAVSVALRRQLAALGTQALVVPMADSIEKTLSAVDTIWQTYQPLHLFLVTAFDEDSATDLEAAAWARRRQRGVLLPFLVCQRWFNHLADSGRLEKASVVVASSLGGDFGLSGGDNAEGGAMLGLGKALCIEYGYTTNWAFRARIVDAAPSESPDEVATVLLREIRSRDPFAEVAYSGGKRYAVAAVYSPASPRPGHQPTRGRPWLFTGGARGITATIARGLAERFGIKLHLVGASPRPQLDPGVHQLDAAALKQVRAELAKQAVAEKKLPADLLKRYQKDVEIDQNLRELEAAGIDFAYHACDVGDRRALARLLDEIRRTDGPLEGIVHGAGIEHSCRFTKKDPAVVDRTIAAKVDGAANLMALTWSDPLRFFFGFGSISGRWGSIGQTDYCLASEMLAKLVNWYRSRRPDCRSVCFHWQPWAAIGMAARDESRGGQMLQELKHLPPREGVEHFIAEMLAGCPDPEIVVTDWNYYKRFYPDVPEEVRAVIMADSPAEPPRAETGQPDTSAAATAGTSPAATPTRDTQSAVALRQVMRLVDKPLDAQRQKFAFSGPAIVLGDNADAHALCEALAARSVTAVCISTEGNIEAALAELESRFHAQPAPHLFVLSARDPDASAIDNHEAWTRRWQSGVLLPYAICRKWIELVRQAGLLESSSLVAATSLGGDFGFAHPIAAPEGGALTGLLKGLYMELVQPNSIPMRIKVVETAVGEPSSAVAAALIAELDDSSYDVEAAYAGKRRRVVRLQEQPVEMLPSRPIERGGVWVFTGGARGITAAAAKALGSRFGLKLHLLGYSPLADIDESLRGPDPKPLQEAKRKLVRQAISEGLPAGTYWDELRKSLEIDDTLQQLKRQGVKATYHTCDVSKRQQLAAALERIRAIDGPISGIVHGAGVHSSPEPIENSPLDSTAELLDIKAAAAMNLMLLTADDPIRYFVGFGSISARFGSVNASPYTMANDLLCKLIGWYRTWRPDCCAVGFHWHPWGEVGMMTRPVSQHTIKIFKMKMMPPAEGVRHLIDELCAGGPESEVLITDHQFRDAFFSADLMVPAEAASDAHPEPGALIERVLELEPDRRAVAEIRLDPVNDPFLREHRLRTRPTLPLVVAIEAFVETAQLLDLGRKTIIGCRDVQIPNAVRLVGDDSLNVRVAAEAAADGINCRLTSDFRNRRGQLVQADRLHFAAQLEASDSPPVFDHCPSALEADWFEVTYPTGDEALYHGPPLRLLKRICVAGERGDGEIHFPRHDELRGARAGAWLTPSAAIDACLYTCGVYTWVIGQQAFTVPQSLGQLRLGRTPQPGEIATVRVTARSESHSEGVFDFTLVGSDETILVQVKDYRCHILHLPRI